MKYVNDLRCYWRQVTQYCVPHEMSLGQLISPEREKPFIEEINSSRPIYPEFKR